jgi:hypothetical protein
VCVAGDWLPRECLLAHELVSTVKDRGRELFQGSGNGESRRNDGGEPSASVLSLIAWNQRPTPFELVAAYLWEE